MSCALCGGGLVVGVVTSGLYISCGLQGQQTIVQLLVYTSRVDVLCGLQQFQLFVISRYFYLEIQQEHLRYFCQISEYLLQIYDIYMKRKNAFLLCLSFWYVCVFLSLYLITVSLNWQTCILYAINWREITVKVILDHFTLLLVSHDNCTVANIMMCSYHNFQIY